MPDPTFGVATFTVAAAKGAHMAFPFVRDAIKEYIADSAVEEALKIGGALSKKDGEAVIDAMGDATQKVHFKNPILNNLFAELSKP